MAKQCSKCGKVKPLTEFHNKSDAPDRKQGRCKACVKINNEEFRTDKPKYQVDWQRTNKRKWNDYVASYQKADKGGKIYAIVNGITNETYIGFTEMFIKVRYNFHVTQYRRYKKGKQSNTIPGLFNSFEKYGLNNHKCKVIAEFDNMSRKELRMMEKSFIQAVMETGKSLNINK
jgi:hypothetical protein